MGFNERSIVFEENGKKTICDLDYYSSEGILHGDYSYVLSIWLIMFNAVSYTSRVKYSQSHTLKFMGLISLVLFTVVGCFCLIVPLMICNEDSQRQGIQYLLDRIRTLAPLGLTIGVLSFRLMTEVACVLNYIQSLRIVVDMF